VQNYFKLGLLEGDSNIQIEWDVAWLSI